jgi:hypothetical protein
MAVKSKLKSKSKVKVKPKKKAAAKAKAPVKKKAMKAAVRKKAQVRKPAVKARAVKKTLVRSAPKLKATRGYKARKPSPLSLGKRSGLKDKPVEVTRSINLVNQIRQPARPAVRRNAASLAAANATLFNFMKAPRPEYAFEVGDSVEVFCDHEKGRERVRGWIKGIVVQVDNKMVAVQFRSNVFLTDGWMVPDRILWYPVTSEHIRPVATGKKPALKKDIIPDY